MPQSYYRCPLTWAIDGVHTPSTTCVGIRRRRCVNAVDDVRTSSSARLFGPSPAFAHVRSLSTTVDGVLRPSTAVTREYSRVRSENATLAFKITG